jgi:flagellar motor switch protein FliM
MGEEPLSSREAPAVRPEEPQPYDFEHPSRLSKEQLRRLDHLHTSLAKRLSVSLAGLLRDFAEVRISEITETHWANLIGSIPTHCAVFMFGAEPLEGTAILHLDPQLALGFVDRIFGGRGEAIDIQRELTAIEQRVVGKAAQAILKEIRVAWGAVTELRIALSDFAASPEFIRASGISESVIVVRLDVKACNIQGKIEIGYPYLMFEPVLRTLGGAVALKPKVTTENEGTARVLETIPVRVSARFPASMISMRHLVDLDEGDILVLDNRVTDDVAVLVEDRDLFLGRPGQVGGRLAIKVTELKKRGGA